jgi:hypothetical protein
MVVAWKICLAATHTWILTTQIDARMTDRKIRAQRFPGAIPEA